VKSPPVSKPDPSSRISSKQPPSSSARRNARWRARAALCCLRRGRQGERRRSVGLKPPAERPAGHEVPLRGLGSSQGSAYPERLPRNGPVHGGGLRGASLPPGLQTTGIPPMRAAPAVTSS
jgi:hypothetical protein